MAAFARAIELGYRYLETDARVTADGVLVAFHDATLDRVTDRGGAIGALPWREVRAARIGGVEPIPLLADVLGAWPSARVILDPKCDGAVGPLVDAIRVAGAFDRVCVGSFSHPRLAAVRAALGPRVATSMSPVELRRLRFAAWGLLPRAAVAGPAACVQMPPDYRRVRLAEPRLIELAHALGLPVHVWTINREPDMRRLLDLGVDGLITDDVETLRTVLRERGTWR